MAIHPVAATVLERCTVIVPALAGAAAATPPHNSATTATAGATPFGEHARLRNNPRTPAPSYAHPRCPTPPGAQRKYAVVISGKPRFARFFISPHACAESPSGAVALPLPGWAG